MMPSFPVAGLKGNIFGRLSVVQGVLWSTFILAKCIEGVVHSPSESLPQMTVLNQRIWKSALRIKLWTELFSENKFLTLYGHRLYSTCMEHHVCYIMQSLVMKGVSSPSSIVVYRRICRYRMQIRSGFLLSLTRQKCMVRWQ